MISRRRALVMIACLTTFALSADGKAQTGAKKSDSVVKVAASADKPDADGKQSVTITLVIDKGWPWKRCTWDRYWMVWSK